MPAKSEVTPNMINLETKLGEVDEAEHPADERGDGHRHRVPPRDSHGALRAGVGVIHKNMPIEKQVDEVRRRSREAENGVIVNPFFLSPDNYVYEADELMGKYKISGVPICDEESTSSAS